MFLVHRVVGCVLQGVPLIATSPVRHELPQNMQPTPVEVHKYSAPWNDFASPSSADMDDVPSPGPAASVVGGLSCADALPLSVLCVQAAVTAVAGTHALSSCESLADSFDDDTVVSFDDLTEVPSTRYVVTQHATSSSQFSGLETHF